MSYNQPEDSATPQPSHTNRLIAEQSPYLLQHAHNPVDWYPWGDEPFERAKKENKPVLVSIGYSACHWCHVMERESFEREEVAAYMNEHFINIKVDREEHPDVDHLYMDAVQALTGSGGWPLNVFITPERLPFYGGTYYPPRPAFNRPSWLQMLERIHHIWTEQADEVKLQTDQMIKHLQQTSQIAAAGTHRDWTMDDCRTMAEALLKQADPVYGGFGNAPKFPGSMAVSFLLEHYHFTGHLPSLAHALKSLDGMINGGIYDQLGGGFARYSTDARWLAPHFEKMLYDNALLVITLCDAWQITKDDRYSRVIRETIAFLDRELKSPAGVYYSALDADSEGVEGKYYTWSWEEWTEVVGEEDRLAASWFGVEQQGNWEHTNILHTPLERSALARQEGLSEDEVAERLASVRLKLIDRRSSRERPLTDDKSLLSWNALMNTALTAAGTALGDSSYLAAAASHMEAMLKAFRTEQGLMHVWKEGRAKISANLDDYAYLIDAMLKLASVTGRLDWIQLAGELTSVVTEEFSHEAGDLFYYTSARQSDIPVRKVDVYDGATPSANAVMAQNLLRLGLCMERSDYLEQAASMLHHIADTAQRYPYSFGFWALQLQRYAVGIRAVVCSGPEAESYCKRLQQHYLPNAYELAAEKEIFNIPLLAGKYFEGETLIFVCTQQACLPPKQTVEESLPVISAY